jgi:hypothetical protein
MSRQVSPAALAAQPRRVPPHCPRRHRATLDHPVHRVQQLMNDARRLHLPALLGSKPLKEKPPRPSPSRYFCRETPIAL